MAQIEISLFICDNQPAIRLTYKNYTTAFFIDKPTSISDFVDVFMIPCLKALVAREGKKTNGTT